MTTTADVLRDSLALLREGGWIKGQLYDKAGAYCARGALEYTAGLGAWRQPEAPLGALAAEMFPERARSKSCPLVDVNNHPDTTFADIEALFEKAILQEGGTL